MDDSLYDDKLSGEIPQDKYEAKHAQFIDERKTLNEKLEKLDGSIGLPWTYPSAPRAFAEGLRALC